MSADQGISGVQQGNKEDRVVSLYQHLGTAGGRGQISERTEGEVYTVHQRASEFFQDGEIGI